MSLRLTATLVKQYFQYRCERQVRYAMLSDEERLALALIEQPEERAPWAQVGLDFERDVLASLSRREAVLRPLPGQYVLDDERTAAFLRGERRETFAYQARLRLARPDEFRRQWSVPPEVDLSAGLPDLIRVLREDSKIHFQLIDIKAVEAPAPFHKAQVAFYALLLEQILREADVPHIIHPTAQIWHPAPDHRPGQACWIETDFRLAGYRAQVADFLCGALARIGAAIVAPGRDDTRFHLYFKCEQCDFLPHCEKSIAPELPAERWDLSAVPGLSQQSKRTLVDNGIRDVGELAAAESLGAPATLGWGLRTGGRALRARARALINRSLGRLPDCLLHLMPTRVDAGLCLVVDHDPVEGRLAALGCLLRWQGREEFFVRLVTSPGPDAEKEALLAVLGRVFAHLQAIDAHNAARGEADPVIAHLFVYEPSEAKDVQAALGRHLEDQRVRQGLLDLIRIFPPEPLDRDPEYAGHRHLPATALRIVFDVLYLLPVQVGHDLRRVCEALDLRTAYRPTPEFAKPFSSRLNIDRCRDLKTGRIDLTVVEADVRARLTALAGLVEWVLADNQAAVKPFLRLRKEPFRFQRTADTLSPGDLGLLEAQELLASRAAELQNLTELALPLEERRDRFRCIGPLTPVGQQDSPRFRGGRRLSFIGPREGRYSEIGEGTYGVILTPDEPDLLLDPDAWDDLGVTVSRLVAFDDRVEIALDVWKDVWAAGTMATLLSQRPDADWALDLRYSNPNAPRLIRFLTHIGAEGGP